MIIRVDPQSSAPVFRQIVDEVKSAISRGACAPGEMIPSVRQLAAQLLVNPNTVARAYRDLERDGIVYTRKGIGVFIADGGQKQSRQDRSGELRENLRRLIAEARRAGLSADDLRQLTEKTLRSEYAPKRGEE